MLAIFPSPPLGVSLGWQSDLQKFALPWPYQAVGSLLLKIRGCFTSREILDKWNNACRAWILREPKHERPNLGHLSITFRGDNCTALTSISELRAASKTSLKVTRHSLLIGVIASLLHFCCLTSVLGRVAIEETEHWWDHQRLMKSTSRCWPQHFGPCSLHASFCKDCPDVAYRLLSTTPRPWVRDQDGRGREEIMQSIEHSITCGAWLCRQQMLCLSPSVSGVWSRSYQLCPVLQPYRCSQNLHSPQDLLNKCSSP